ncbi:MAG: bifunctional phosphoribosylaminoimidazolecarboxamide formyltransferase/IMP cyclohydrolase [Bacteroidota bacterium]|nr:bifunctional phosphoribosylaminoimidazolecarboxamide formyltransferase/IMP cyclohydrolase [Bacteroidota bacterium]
MTEIPKQIKSALISVYHKDGLDDIIKLLIDNSVTIYSTGGTLDFINSLGFQAIAVENVTDFPSILGGRVKTLHPKIFGGILNRSENDADLLEMNQYQIPNIDLVIVDLYPFRETVKSGASHDNIIEKIDIGGISLIRAGAKNYQDVCIISNQSQYSELLQVLTENNAETKENYRKKLATEAFLITSNYDAEISQYFIEDYENDQDISILRYGENPHQKAWYEGDLNQVFEKLHGKELSYNNLVDVDAAWRLVCDFPILGFAIIKHTNACGAAIDDDLEKAWHKALSADPTSAFGGIIATNGTITKDIASEINKIFCEVVLAEVIDVDALEILSRKKNRIVLKMKPRSKSILNEKTLFNGKIVQESDLNIETEAALKFVTKLKPSQEQIADLLFANIICKHIKSNAIVLVKGLQMIGMGCGQTSRIDALNQAIGKAKKFNFDTKAAVMASDAFFPFADCVTVADQNGINAVIHPGGSIKDQDSISYCDENGMSMVVTGVRHFLH